MAFGSGYPETGSTNRSAIHWDMICDLRHGGEVTVDGELFAKDGKYVLGMIKGWRATQIRGCRLGLPRSVSHQRGV